MTQIVLTFFSVVFSAVLAMTQAANAESEVSYAILGFEDLDGWDKDDHAAALTVFRNTCRDMKDPDWTSLCNLASEAGNARQFFELFFRPVQITNGTDGLFTGYFEPELDGAPYKSDRYRYPIYKMPSEARSQRPWLTRRDILTSGVMDNRGLEITWVDDAVELFFLQIQGSGRVRYPDGSYIRVGYGGANGHSYRSIGQEMVRRGIYSPHQVSAQVIKSWVRRNPVEGQELLFHNQSYVFFREVSEVPSHKGPLGAMNRSITTMRSIAVDPDFTPLGAPVWIEKSGKNPLRRLMIAQDTGSAIKGAQRADIFIGTGDKAGQIAGRIKDPGRLVVLMPIQRAYALLPEAVQ
ncbi:membrane-bound lytic murein transglycosylase A [Pelagimonas varians]|uniref:peptidoglycan lytic exotransglycosylase n=2 Tax=Pelagimonas varians TaxID=696760 RepID=A0A238L4M7_9RHOB|nr:membrane-bound lytic murein transglycosylase A [Pelagimonas varians]SMX49352.1 Membrane-bound lytic murein transglycosylase A precursor [Pelagimonas varians]